MKKLVINGLMSNINKFYNYDETKLAEIKYGLEAIYLLVTKTVIIFALAFILGVFNELLLLMITYSLLRTTGFGVHAKKSWHCWASSLLIFLGAPMLCKYLSLGKPVLIIISLLSTVLLFKYAPADTEKRPIISRVRRRIYKICCTSTALVFIILIGLTESVILENCLLFAILIQTFMVLPTSYKIFDVKYNNYLTYTKASEYQR